MILFSQRADVLWVNLFLSAQINGEGHNQYMKSELLNRDASQITIGIDLANLP